MEIAAAILVVLISIIGIALTVVTLPGTWIMIAGAVLIELFWLPDMFGAWTLGIAFALALLAELVELIASAAGAKKAGGTKRGAFGAIGGSLIGALVGSPILFPIGAIAGGVVGAGLGTILLERVWAKRTWQESAKAGQGAAVGRFFATVMKTAFAVAIGTLLCIAAFVP